MLLDNFHGVEGVALGNLGLDLSNDVAQVGLVLYWRFSQHFTLLCRCTWPNSI